MKHAINLKLQRNDIWGRSFFLGHFKNAYLLKERETFVSDKMPARDAVSEIRTHASSPPILRQSVKCRP